MSSACPWGRTPGQPGEYVGEYKGMNWLLCPWAAENSRHCFEFEGKGWGNSKFCKITDANHGGIRGICRFPWVLPFVCFRHLFLFSHNKFRREIGCEGWWLLVARGVTAFFDVRVSHVNSKTNQRKPTVAIFKEQESEKKRKYQQRVLEVEMGSFTMKGY